MFLFLHTTIVEPPPQRHLPTAHPTTRGKAQGRRDPVSRLRVARNPGQCSLHDSPSPGNPRLGDGVHRHNPPPSAHPPHHGGAPGRRKPVARLRFARTPGQHRRNDPLSPGNPRLGAEADPRLPTPTAQPPHRGGTQGRRKPVSGLRFARTPEQGSLRRPPSPGNPRLGVAVNQLTPPPSAHRLSAGKAQRRRATVPGLLCARTFG